MNKPINIPKIQVNQDKRLWEFLNKSVTISPEDYTKYWINNIISSKTGKHQSITNSYYAPKIFSNRKTLKINAKYVLLSDSSNTANCLNKKTNQLEPKDFYNLTFWISNDELYEMNFDTEFGKSEFVKNIQNHLGDYEDKSISTLIKIKSFQFIKSIWFLFVKTK